MSQNPPEKQPDRKPDAWGRDVNRADGPPELDVLLSNLKKKLFETTWRLKKNAGGNGNPPSQGKNFVNQSYFLFVGIIVVVVLIWVLAGIFIVAPAERAVITQFGKYVETLGSGPHWILCGIQTKQIVNVQRVSNYAYESQMLTKDENIVSVAVAVQFRVEDAKDFLFSVVSPINSLEQATASALRQVVGHNTLDDLLTTGRSEVRGQVADQLQEILGSYHAGIVVTDVTLQSIKPPEAVTAAFDDAIKAREDQQAYINQADAYANQVLAAAQGQVARILRQADAYKQEVVLEAQAAVAGYLALLPEYLKAPQVMRKRLYLNTIESVLSKTTKVFLDQKNANPLLYLPLDKLMGSSTSLSQTSPSVSPSLNTSNTRISSSVSADMENVLMDRPTYPAREGENK